MRLPNPGVIPLPLISDHGSGVWNSLVRSATSGWHPLDPPLAAAAGTVSNGHCRAPGTNSLDPMHQCTWQRLRGWSGENSDYLDGGGGMADAPVQVTIAATDVGFRSTDCGTWTKVG